jgi:N-acetylglucosamine transport system permease protein
MRRGSKYFFIISFLAVPVALYSVFVVAAYIQTFTLSLKTWSGLGSIPTRSSFDNYVTLWHDSLFWMSLRHNIVLLIALPIITIFVALVIAFLLNVGGGFQGGVTRGVWGSKTYRVIFFFPQLLALAIVAVIFGRVFAPDQSGLLNGLLPTSSAQIWLADKRLALICILVVLIWQAIGFYVVLFSAAMGSIPTDIYEAAALDGATRFKLFFRITIPLLWNTVQVAWVYLGIAAFDAFPLVNIMSVDRGGPDGATSVLSMMIYRNTFELSKVGYASALGVVLFFLTLTFAALTLRVTRRDSVEL